MLNKYPLWKYLMVIFVVAIGLLYAVPNLYQADLAVQVSGAKGKEATTTELAEVQQVLKDHGLQPKRAGMENGQLTVRFNNNEDQLKGRELIADTLGSEWIVALAKADNTPGWLAAIGGSPMKLGLDLSGGVHFLMEVDMDEALRKKSEDLVSAYKLTLRQEKIRYRSVRRSQGGIEITFRKVEDLEKGERLLKNNYRDMLFLDKPGDELTLVSRMSDDKIKLERTTAVEQNIKIIRNRINELGVAEPMVQRQGAERIVVELPGVQDTARAKGILGKTATVAFHEVDTKNDIGNALSGRVPAGSKLLYGTDGTPYLIKKREIVQGTSIVDANAGFDEYSRPQVNITLDSKGGSKMSNFTKDKIGQPMATVFIEYREDGKDAEGKPKLKKVEEVINSARIQSRLGNSFRITGIDSPSEAQNLALLLRAGALIAPIRIVEERTVGPSLGQQNIEMGFMAIIWGFALVLVFMVIYYKKFGLVANMALAANLILIVGVMSMIPGATLTLPGMAGIVLTVGMAVDANVLIFERIREELREGRSPQQAIHHGYDSAFSTIADANITTLIAAIILFAVGTGPIQGFAVTLSIGILTSMFTAIVGTRAIVNLAWGGKRVDNLSI